jgi:triacylglycerol lipase
VVLLLGGGGARAQSLPAPGTPPPGANDPGCRPTAAHPDPVVLVHGSFGDMTASWNLISPVLHGLGYCVFALDYGHRGTDPVEQSAAELGAFVDRVLAATGASHVLVVGHSQGGMMPRYWMRFLGGAATVRGLVGLAPSNHGTTVAAAAGRRRRRLRLLRRAAGGLSVPDPAQRRRRHPSRGQLHGHPDPHDEVVTPYTSAFLSGPRVTDVTLQDRCPLDLIEHVGIIYDPVTLQWVVDALGHAGLAEPGFSPIC